MEMFSRCGDCDNCHIHYLGGCLAGHGDDDFEPLTLERVDRLLAKDDLVDWKREELLVHRFKLLNTADGGQL